MAMSPLVPMYAIFGSCVQAVSKVIVEVKDVEPMSSYNLLGKKVSF